MSLPKTCGACYFWDQESLHADVGESLGKVPGELDDWGYCRHSPPGPGIGDHPWETIAVTRSTDWCGQNQDTASDVKDFLRDNPDLTPVDPGGEWD